MNLSQDGLELLKEFEGVKLVAYKCSAGIWTLGIGSTIFQGKPVEKNQTCTLKEAEEQCKNDLKVFEKSLSKVIKKELNQNQIDALILLCYNIGRTAFKNSTILKKVNLNPQDPSISAEFLNWCYANKIKVKGLVIRREKEAKLYFK